MTNISQTNPCTRCGKERIVTESVEEVVNLSTIVTTTMICPDPECQKKVDQQLEKEKVAREQLKVNSHTNQRNRHQPSDDDDD